MARCKQHYIKIFDSAGNCILEETRDGGAKSKRNVYSRTALADADKLLHAGAPCTVWFAQSGAKRYAVYSYVAGSGIAELVGAVDKND